MTDLQYWIDLCECECASEHPIGGCEKCDLIKAQATIKELLEFAEECIYDTGIDSSRRITAIELTAKYGEEQ